MSENAGRLDKVAHYTLFNGLFSEDIWPLVMGKSDTLLFPGYVWFWLKVRANYSPFDEKALDCCSWFRISRRRLFVETFTRAVLPTVDFNYDCNNPYLTVWLDLGLSSNGVRAERPSSRGAQLVDQASSCQARLNLSGCFPHETVVVTTIRMIDVVFSEAMVASPTRGRDILNLRVKC